MQKNETQIKPNLDEILYIGYDIQVQVGLQFRKDWVRIATVSPLKALDHKQQSTNMITSLIFPQSHVGLCVN